MIDSNPEFDNLYDVLTDFSNKTLERECLEKILTSNPTLEEVEKIISTSRTFLNEELRDQAAEYMFQHWPQRDTYLFLAKYSNKQAQPAWHKLLDLNPTTQEMIDILERCSHIENEVWGELKKRELTEEELEELEVNCCWMIDEIEEYRTRDNRRSIMDQIKKLKD